METMRINALSYVLMITQNRSLILSSVFLAIKHASAAMEKACSLKGKIEGGGSIILTASGDCASLAY